MDGQVKNKPVPAVASQGEARIPKETIRAVVRTPDLLIVGQFHARPEKRLKDELNLTSERFLAITEAKVYDAAGERFLYATPFLLVGSPHIVTVTPFDVLAAAPDAIWARP